MTVIPLFCSRFLTHVEHGPATEHGEAGAPRGWGARFNAWFNRGFGRLLDVYERWVRQALRRPALTVALLAGLFVASVRSTAVVDYNAALDFGGYGIRNGRRGTAYIARGNRGVELAMNDGRKIVIGSQRPDELARRIAETRSRTAV